MQKGEELVRAHAVRNSPSAGVSLPASALQPRIERQETARGGRKPAEMESKAKRTLVKSAPELWELADDLARMEAWMGGLLGSAQPVRIEVTDRKPERVLAWRDADPASGGRIAIELAESGFGTSVRIDRPALPPGPRRGDRGAGGATR